jgi:DNA (cytosine-5)-methyltransferase 1
MRWMDLSDHGLRLKVTQAGGGAPMLQLSGNAAAVRTEAMRDLGFVHCDGVWLRDGASVPSTFWRALAGTFPKARVVDIPVDAVFGREAPRPNGPRQVEYTTVGESRGRPRLWLEGMRLADAGFTPGAAYTVALDTETRTITLTLDPAGDRHVSKRTKALKSGVRVKPLIEVADASLTDVLGDAGRVRAVLGDGSITFTLHPADRARAERERRLADHLTQGRLTTGTLCAGGGVSTLAGKEGLQRAGLESTVEWVVDREPAYLQAALDNNPAVTDLTRIVVASIEELERADLTPVDKVSVSLPCTGHSLSGKAKRGLKIAEEHPTDALAVYGLLKVLEATNPSIVESENVPEAATSASYALVRAYLREQGYAIAECVMDAKEGACLEDRSRWWMVAISKGFAEGLSLEALPERDRQHARLGDAMEHVPADDPSWSTHDYLDSKAERDQRDGKGFKRQFVNADSTRVGTIGKGYAKRRSTEPFVKREDGMERLLTPAEHARVKGIPESLIRDLSATLAHEILGQSILHEHASVLAEAVGAHLLRVMRSRTLPDAEAREAPARSADQAAEWAPR